MDTLEEAKRIMRYWEEHDGVNATAAVAYALIALVERLDTLTTKVPPAWEDQTVPAIRTYSFTAPEEG